MSQTVDAKNKGLNLKAFDTLFNRRDYKTAVTTRDIPTRGGK